MWFGLGQEYHYHDMYDYAWDMHSRTEWMCPRGAGHIHYLDMGKGMR